MTIGTQAVSSFLNVKVKKGTLVSFLQTKITFWIANCDVLQLRNK